MYQTALHQGERLQFAPENEDRGREGAISSRDSGGDQLSEYNEDSSDSESDDVAVEESSALSHVQNKELGFLFAAPRTRSERMVKTSNKALLWV